MSTFEICYYIFYDFKKEYTMKLNQYFSFILSILIISIFSWAFYTSSGFFLQKEKQQKTYTIGLLVMATGQQYLEAAKRMIESAQVHFVKIIKLIILYLLIVQLIYPEIQ